MNCLFFDIECGSHRGNKGKICEPVYIQKVKERRL